MSKNHPTAPSAPVKAPQQGKSTTPATHARGKPEKPSPDFPLFADAARVWAKKIRGKVHYFGPLDDPEGAKRRYEAGAEALHAGRKPRQENIGTTVKELANNFVNHKKALVKAGELSPVLGTPTSLPASR